MRTCEKRSNGAAGHKEAFSTVTIYVINDIRYAWLMLTTLDPVRSDRKFLRFTLFAFGSAVIWVVFDGVVQLWSAVSRGVVAVVLRPPFEPVVTQSPSGTFQEQREFLHLQIEAAELSGTAVGWLRAADIVQVLCWVALLVLAALLITRIGQGRLFDHRFQLLLNGVCVALLCVAALPALAALIGTNVAISDLGYGAWGDPGARPGAAATSDAWIIFLVVLFVSGLQVAFRSAARLARDQDGVI